MNKVYFVAKKVEWRGKRRLSRFAVGEVGRALPKGFKEVQDRNGRNVTRTLQMNKALSEAKRLEGRG